MPDPRPLAELTPARLELDVAVPVPETRLTATLLERSYGRGRDGLASRARIRLDGPDGASDTLDGPFYQAFTALGRRFYLGGSRSETLLYALDT